MAYIHAFTESGLGKAPFSLVEMRENAFNIGDGSTKAGGSCDHCGTGIRWEFVVRSADGKTSTVGSSCIKKAGDKGLIDLAKRAKTEAARAQRNAERMAAHEKLMQAQRDRNGGLTDWEVHQRNVEEEDNRRIRQELGRAALLAPISEELRDGRGRFNDSIADDLDRGVLPTPRATEIVAEILAKNAGKKGSDAFLSRQEQIRKIFKQAEEI